MLEVLTEDYIRTAHAKGLTSNSTVLMRHALKNAAVPIVTIIGIGIALLIGGVVVTESVFNIPGLGRLTVDAILRRDYPIIQGVILVFAGVYVLINLLVDISLHLVRSRASATEEGAESMVATTPADLRSRPPRPVRSERASRVPTGATRPL